MKSAKRTSLIVAILSVTFVGSPMAAWTAEPAGGSQTAAQVFEERIMPIFKSEKPSSCVQCHLSSVDIKNYILPSARDTFLALREQGLVDVDAPAESKILTLIAMGDKDQDAGARLIHEATRKAEFDAFSNWIAACCNDPELRELAAPKDLASVGPNKPLEIVRHARKSRVAESFARNVWSQRMRCFPCHTPHEIDESNPKHKGLMQKHEDFVKQYGAKMAFFQKTPEETMAKLIASSQHRIRGRYPLINIEEPSKSLLLLKPTAKLPPKNEDGEFEPPSSRDPVSHMGGLKMHVNDQSYKAFMLWLKDYAAVAGDEYVSVEDLPADNWIPTKRILRVQNAPVEWGDGTVVHLFVHKWDADAKAWSNEPIAFTQGPINPRRVVIGPLSIFRPDRPSKPTSDRAFPLRPGEYLIKAYVDADNEIAEDPTLLLGEKAFAGQTAINARWQLGFPQAQTFSAERLKK